MNWRDFEFTEGSSGKFWKIQLVGRVCTVHFGRIGSVGQEKIKTFSTPEKAKEAYEKIIAEKLAKGYRETTVSQVIETAVTEGSAFRQADASMSILWKRFEDYLGRHAPAVLKSLAAPATLDEIRAAEKKIGMQFPPDFAASLLIHNGQSEDIPLVPSLYDSDERDYIATWGELARLDHIVATTEMYQGFEFDEAEEEDKRIGPVRPDARRCSIIFVDSGSGDVLGLDLNPALNGCVGQVLSIVHDPSSLFVLAPSYAAWFAELVQRYESGRYVFMSRDGLIEEPQDRAGPNYREKLLEGLAAAGRSEEDAFIRAILEDPNSDAPRLAYASLLEQQGDPRAAYLRAQCGTDSATVSRLGAVLEPWWVDLVRRPADKLPARRGQELDREIAAFCLAIHDGDTQALPSLADHLQKSGRAKGLRAKALATSELGDHKARVKVILDALPVEYVWLYMADIAERIVHWYEEAFPHDKRPRQAIEARRKWARGEITDSDLQVATRVAEAALEDTQNSESPRDDLGAVVGAAQQVVQEWPPAWEAFEIVSTCVLEAIKEDCGKTAYKAELDWQFFRLRAYLEGSLETVSVVEPVERGKKAKAQNDEYDLVQMYVDRKRYDWALEEIDKRIERNPRDSDNVRLRGWIHEKLGNYTQTKADYEEAVRLGETDGTLNSLAWILATAPVAKLRDGARAVELALRACEATQWEVPGYLDTLAAAYANCGQFEQAIASEEKAIKLTKDRDDRQRYRDCLQSYRSGQPYRLPPEAIDGTRQFSLEIKWRGTQNTYFPLDAREPVRIEARVPFLMYAALFELDSAGTLKCLATAAPAGAEYTFSYPAADKFAPLAGAIGTTLILLCARSSAPISVEDVADVLVGDAAWPVLPDESTVGICPELVWTGTATAQEVVSKHSPQGQMRRRLDALRLKLRDRFPLFEGWALTRR